MKWLGIAAAAAEEVATEGVVVVVAEAAVVDIAVQIQPLWVEDAGGNFGAHHLPKRFLPHVSLCAQPHFSALLLFELGWFSSGEGPSGTRLLPTQALAHFRFQYPLRFICRLSGAVGPSIQGSICQDEAGRRVVFFFFSFQRSDAW